MNTSPPSADSYDVIVVGGSAAGCTAARLFAQQGLSVLLVEQHVGNDWYKRLCTHYIQASAVPTIARLGLDPLLEQAGGVRSRMQIWTRFGWVKHAPGDHPETFGWSVRRQTLDPLLRRLADETPGVEFRCGWTARELLWTGGRIAGLKLVDRDRQPRDIRAKLIVMADGRHTQLAELEKFPVIVRPNQRFTYYAYYRGLRLTSGNDSQFWMMDPDAAYALPVEDDLTLIACWPTKKWLPEFKRDREASFRRLLTGLVEFPDLDAGERVSDLLGALDLPLRVRNFVLPGLAFVGDAAFAPDPLWGVGCGFAFQSAEWLVERTAAAVRSGESRQIDRGLHAYLKHHRRMLGGHFMTLADYATGRKFRLLERLYFSAGTRDEVLAELLLAFGARRVGPWQFLRPAHLARACWQAMTGVSGDPRDGALTAATAR
jgi:2-polyprenyl-6-methoxyphenol hydroxylase-like FAD-dependent oxidoreductase